MILRGEYPELFCMQNNWFECTHAVTRPQDMRHCGFILDPRACLGHFGSNDLLHYSELHVSTRGVAFFCMHESSKCRTLSFHACYTRAVSLSSAVVRVVSSSCAAPLITAPKVPRKSCVCIKNTHESLAGNFDGCTAP